MDYPHYLVIAAQGLPTLSGHCSPGTTHTIWSLLNRDYPHYLVIAEQGLPKLSGHYCSGTTHTIWSLQPRSYPHCTFGHCGPGATHTVHLVTAAQELPTLYIWSLLPRGYPHCIFGHCGPGATHTVHLVTAAQELPTLYIWSLLPRGYPHCTFGHCVGLEFDPKPGPQLAVRVQARNNFSSPAQARKLEFRPDPDRECLAQARPGPQVSGPAHTHRPKMGKPAARKPAAH